MNQGVKNRALARKMLAGMVMTLTLSACGGVGISSQAPADRPHLQAEAALQRWADAVAAAGGQQGLAVVGDRTGQVGDWEPGVGGNNKLALLAGKVRGGIALPTDTPDPAAVQWEDGSVRTLPLMSAAQALQELQDSAGQACPDCAALEITGAKLESVHVETTRGGATAPAWDFSLRGTAVHRTQVAIPAAATVQVSAPPSDPSDPPVGISIDFATGRVGSLDLTVYFVGAIGPKSDPCGADYEAEAVESPLAIVVIVVEDPHFPGGGCRLVGTTRIATVHLDQPLGDRAMLEVRGGLPVPVTMRP